MFFTYSSQALGVLSAHEQWFQSCCYGKWPQGGSMLIPNSGYWGNQSLRQNPVPGLSIRMECARRLSRSSARRNAQGLCPIPSCFLRAVPWTQPGPGAALCRVLSSQVWRPEGRNMEAGTLSARAVEPRALFKALLGQRRHRPLGVLDGVSPQEDLSLFPSARRQSIHGPQACPGFRAVAAA